MEQVENIAKRGNRKERVGVVASDAQDKTIIVVVARRTAHPMYKKVIKKRNKFVAHDEQNDAKKGDTVRISETRPLSKTKRWRLVEVIRRAN